MNIIQMMAKVDFYNDRVRSARFSDDQYINALNDATQMAIDDRLGNKKVKRGYSFQSDQQVRDDLYTLISNPPATIVPTNDVLAYPTDYYFFVMLETTIDGVTDYSRPTDFNKIGPLQKNPFSKPSNAKTYYNETESGLKVYYGNGSFTSAKLTYLRFPKKLSTGKESDKISSGASVLTIGISYIAYEQSIHGTTTYYPGDIFVAANTTLVSGVVIPVSVIQSSDLPDKIQDEIAKRAAGIMQKTIEDYNKSQGIDLEVEKT